MRAWNKFLIGLNMLTVIGGAGRIADSIDSSDYDTTAATAAEYHMNRGESISAAEAQAFSAAKDDKKDGLTGTFQLLLGLSTIAFIGATSALEKKRQEEEKNKNTPAPTPIVSVPANPKCKFET
jgi:hypothetical protein